MTLYTAELLLAIPKQSGMRTDLETSSGHSDEVKTKRQTIEEMGYNRQDANDYEQMAKHPDVVKIVKGHRIYRHPIILFAMPFFVRVI